MEKKKIDFEKITKNVIANWKLYSKTVGAAFVIGIVIAFSIPKTYSTTVILAPESAGSSINGDINALASMAGVNLGLGNNNDALYPQIYPKIFSSNDFIIPLWNLHVETIDNKVSTTLYEYMKRYQKTEWWNYWRKGVAYIATKIRGTKKQQSSISKPNPFQLTEEQDNVTAAIKGMLKCDVDAKTDVISITANAQDAKVATLLADASCKALQNYIIRYRTNKANNDLAYLKKLCAESKVEYEQAQRKYATYADANNEIVLESYKAKLEALENDMQLKYNTYSQFMLQVQGAHAKVQERTPAFTIMQSASIPLKKSSPRRMMIIAVCMAFAFICTLAYTTRKEEKLIERM